MATGTNAGGTWDTNAGNKTVVATPAASDLIVVVHGMSGWASGDDSVVTDNNADGNGNYYRIGTATAPMSTGGGTAGALWISVRNFLIGSATSTTFTVTNTGDTGGGLTVLRFSGMQRTGHRAVRQSSGESNQTENPPSITFNGFGNDAADATRSTNAIVLACFAEDNPASLTPPTGFTEAEDTGYATPTSGVQVCWVDSGQNTDFYSWSGGAVTDHNEVGVELDASALAIKDLIGARIVPFLR